MTENGERDFPPAFLRRCVRFTMPAPTPGELTRIVRAHLGDAADSATDMIETFAERVASGELLAIDQLLNAVLVLSGDHLPTPKRTGAPGKPPSATALACLTTWTGSLPQLLR